MSETATQRKTGGAWHVECGRCNHVFAVTPEEIRDGSWLRLCPVCNDPGSAHKPRKEH